MSFFSELPSYIAPIITALDFHSWTRYFKLISPHFNGIFWKVINAVSQIFVFFLLFFYFFRFLSIFFRANHHPLTPSLHYRFIITTLFNCTHLNSPIALNYQQKKQHYFHFFIFDFLIFWFFVPKNNHKNFQNNLICFFFLFPHFVQFPSPHSLFNTSFQSSQIY